MINDCVPRPVTLTKKDEPYVGFRVALRTIGLLLERKNRRIRKEKGVTWGDALFNCRKSSSLGSVMGRYRHMVRFGDQIILDSVFPPFPSKAFNKRMANYVNNVDMQEMPSGIVSMSITNCCPYACAFCSTNAHRKPENDLDEGLVRKVIHQIQDLGVAQMILHGGEPMFRYDRFLRLIKEVRDDVCLWTFTTGYGVTAEKARELKDAGLFGVWVSLDHYDPATHNKWRGNPEAFDNAVRAVGHFQKAGLYTCLSLVPSDELLEPEGFKKFYDLARDLGVGEIRVLEKKPSGREACRGVIPHSPVLEQLQKDLSKDPAYADYPPLSGLSTWLEKDPALGCQCRFEYLYVTATGDVQPCEASEISFGNIKDEDFHTIYQRACDAFPRPSTGCIPMVMYPEVREFQKRRDSLSSPEKSDLSTQIMAEFQARGKVPGVFHRIWGEYESRVEEYRKRKAEKHSPRP